MSLFTVQNCCPSCYWTISRQTLSKSRLPIPEFSGSHCTVIENLEILYPKILKNIIKIDAVNKC